MTHSQLLEDKISALGIKKSYIANELGITLPTLKRKINNENEFKISEVVTICKILGVTEEDEKNSLFFNTDVE